MFLDSSMYDARMVHASMMRYLTFCVLIFCLLVKSVEMLSLSEKCELSLTTENFFNEVLQDIYKQVCRSLFNFLF